MQQRLVDRRTFALAGAAALSSCAQFKNSAFLTTIENTGRRTGPAIDQKLVDSIPYASIELWFDGGSRALAVLAEYLDNDRLVWRTADHQSVVTWGPYVIAVIGLDVDLRSTAFVGSWSSDLRAMVGTRVGRTLSYQTKAQHVDVSTRSSFTQGGVEDVRIFDRRVRLRRVREHVVANSRRLYANDYWIEEATGFCWRSRQRVIPTMPPFNILTGRPPLPAKADN